MASLGQELKKQRESRGISIDEMASSTKIAGRYLEALEQDRIDAMPGGFFVKGILRTYAKYVGLDEAEVLAKYEAAGVLGDQTASRSEGNEEPAAPPKRSRALVWSIVGAAVVLLAVASVVLLRSRGPRAKSTPEPMATALPKTSPAAPVLEVEKQAPEPEPVQEEWKGLTMEIAFQEETWIELYTDGTLRVSGLFPAGEKARAQAEKEILITVLGNAGGVTYLLNGQPGKILGRSGQVLNNVRITPDNLKDFLQARQPAGPSH